MADGSIPLGKALEEFYNSPSTAVGMRTELSRFSRLCGKDCPMFAVTSSETKEFFMEVKKPAERKKRAEALESFFEYAKEKGWVRINLGIGLIKKKEPKIKKKPVPVRKNPVQISLEGKQKLKDEIDQLLKVKTRVVEEVKNAREEGDLSENAGYHDARERLALIEAQIREKEDVIARASNLQ